MHNNSSNQKQSHHHTNRELIRVGRYLNEIIEVKDATGNLIHKIVRPLRVEFYSRDVMQVIVGATLLAIPVSLSEEVWKLGERLSLRNTFFIALISILFISLFIYYNNYHGVYLHHRRHFLHRIITTYGLAFSLALLFLWLIGQVDLAANLVVSLKKATIVALPASMSAAVADMIK